MKPNEQNFRISKENTSAFVKKVFSSNIFLNKSLLKLYEMFFSGRTSNYMRKSVMDSCTYFAIVITGDINFKAGILVYIPIFT